MRYDNLRSPLSETDPCGPDLDETGDDDYANYMLLASGRLPSKFYSVRDTGEEAPFDKKSIDLDDELETIGGFLRRSRDVRLLTLEARFQILAGNLVGFSEAVQGLAVLVGDFWDHFVPRPYEGDNMLRQNTIEGLDDPIQILLPLQYAALVVGTGSLPTVTYRNYSVAAGKAKARDKEEVIKLADLEKTLSDASMAAKATESHEAILATLAALRVIRNTFVARAGHEFSPNFDRLNALLVSMDEVIVSHRPELAPAQPAETAEEAAGTDGEAAGGPVTMTVAVAPATMPDHAAARAALLAVEAYFRRQEPSSPAFILVHQAVSLIGRPLVEALAVLMPSQSAKAALHLGGSYEFDIDMDRMKSITEEALAAPLPDPPDPPDVTAAPAAAGEAGRDDGATGEGPAADDGARDAAPAAVPSVPSGAGAVPIFVARTRADAAGLMQSAEAFFRLIEPSSPIPLLLEKGRGYLNRDFASIMNELAPKPRN